MTIIATSDFKKITFNWNEELTECNYVSLGVSDETIEDLINNKVHEGSDYEGWEVEIK